MRFPIAALLVCAASLAADDRDEARALLAQHQNEAAIKLLRDAIAKHPADVKSVVLLGNVLLHNERFDEADQLINAALKANPDSAPLHVTRGDIVLREGQPFEADKEYKAAAKLDAKNALAYFGAARIFDMASLRASAAKLFRTAHELSPRNAAIETRFYELEGNSPANIERWQDRLASLEDPNSKLALYLAQRIAVAKALNGKPEFELASGYSTYQAPMVPVTDRGRVRAVGINVAIDRAKTVLELDTGASGLIVNRKFAEHAGVQRLADTEVGGIGNGPPKKGWVGFAPEIKIGPVVFRNCTLRVADNVAPNDSDGLIGTDIFRRFLVKLNFYGRKVELSPLPGPEWDGNQPVDRSTLPEMNGFSQMLTIGHELLVPGKVSEEAGEDQSPGMFLIDTGSGRTLVSTGVAADVTRMRDDRSGAVRGLNGEVKKVYTADKIVLEFATFRQKKLDVLSFDLTNISRYSGTEVTAILGLPLLALFRSITLDYRDGLIKFEYKP